MKVLEKISGIFAPKGYSDRLSCTIYHNALAGTFAGKGVWVGNCASYGIY